MFVLSQPAIVRGTYYISTLHLRRSQRVNIPSSYSMADQTTTLKDFLSFDLRPVLSSRLYLLNKPCSLCHLGTNIRVSKPTCSHRICSTCLARFENGTNEEKSVECPTCSTYWFTLQPGSGHPDGNVPPGTDLFLHIVQRSKEIERQICGGEDFSLPSKIRKESTQKSDSKADEHLGHTTDLSADTTTLPQGFPGNNRKTDLQDRHSGSSKAQVEVRVPEEPGIICRNLITNDKAIETPIIKQNFPTEPHATPISSCTIPSAMKSNRPKLKSTNIRSVRFSIAEVQASGQPIDSSHNMSLKTTQNYSASTVSRKKRNFDLIWPVILLVLGCVLFECIGHVFVRVFLSPTV